MFVIQLQLCVMESVYHAENFILSFYKSVPYLFLSG